MEKYVCKTCGSDNILIRAWIDPHTSKAEDHMWDTDECYCRVCGERRNYNIIKIKVK